MLNFTQCKQIAEIQDLRETVASLQDIPAWIEELSFSDIQAINQGGCASGAYMPAVTYAQAAATMAEHGDDVLDFITDNLGELPQLNQAQSWGGIAVFFLSHAVELWAGQFSELDSVDWD